MGKKKEARIFPQLSPLKKSGLLVGSRVAATPLSRKEDQRCAEVYPQSKKLETNKCEHFCTCLKCAKRAEHPQLEGI